MREKIVSIIAWSLLAAGVSTADSECLFVPLLLAFTGAFILLKVCH